MQLVNFLMHWKSSEYGTRGLHLNSCTSQQLHVIYVSNRLQQSYVFTFLHLPDTFVQFDKFIQVFPGIEPTTFEFAKE